MQEDTEIITKGLSCWGMTRHFILIRKHAAPCTESCVWCGGGPACVWLVSPAVSRRPHSRTGEVVLLEPGGML